MRTSKPFSTISYNSKLFLQMALDEMVQQGKIYFYVAVYHYPEEDESKAHWHLLMYPNGQVDTDVLFKRLEEYDPNKPLQPLRCLMPNKTNSFGDWYLYALHDKKYLRAHGNQDRKYTYSDADFLCSNFDELNELKHTIDYRKLYGNQGFLEGLAEGKSLLQMVQEGTIPMQQYLPHRALFTDIFEGVSSTVRGVSETHTPIVQDDDEYK